jgi:hypothetical protein
MPPVSLGVSGSLHAHFALISEMKKAANPSGFFRYFGLNLK